MNGAMATTANAAATVGQSIPHNLDFQDQKGKQRNFADLVGKKGMILVFVRSAEWCPYCQKQLIDFNKNAKQFTDEGYNIVSVSYDTPAAMEKFVTTNKPSFPMLSDPRSDSIRAFGILNEQSAIGTRSYGIPNPHVYIVSKDKKIQAKFAESDYKNRPSLDKILAEVKKLNPPPEPVASPMTMDNMGQDPIISGEDMIVVPEATQEPLVPVEDMGEILVPDEVMSVEPVPAEVPPFKVEQPIVDDPAMNIQPIDPNATMPIDSAQPSKQDAM